MEAVTERLLNDLITCKKNAVRADRKGLLVSNRHKKNTVYLTSQDGNYEFKMFMRQSEEFIEDFSIGLIWTNPTTYIDISKNSVILLRCQGPHDGKAPLGTDLHHDYHIHRITLDDFKAKRYQKPSGRTSTSDFSSFEQAIFYFISACNIQNIDSVVNLPEGVSQTSLF